MSGAKRVAVPMYVPAAPLVDVLWEQFEFLMDSGANPGRATKSDIDRMAEVCAILLDPFRGHDMARLHA